jgi:hypothetical protein
MADQPVNVAPSTGADPDVKIPAAVARAAKLAESFYQATPDADVPAQEVSAEPAATEPEQVPEQEPTPPSTDWEHRYHSMEGRVKKGEQIIHNLLGQVQQLSEPRPHPQLQPEPQKRSFVTEEERKTYGDDFFDVVSRKALETVQPHIERLAHENHQLRQRLGRDEARSIYDILDEQVPNWRSINTSPEFLSWLSLPDRYSGHVKAGLLKSAFAAGEAGRVLIFFRGFLEEHPELGQQTAAPQVAPAAPAPKRQASVQLRDLAAPGKARPAPGGTQVPVEPAVITNKDLDRFYADVRRGRWDGRPQEKATEEARLHAAVRDGRVRIVK